MYEIEIITSALPVGIVGIPYEVTLEVKTRPVSNNIHWECENELPFGFTLDENKGVISGTTYDGFLGTITIWAQRLDSGDSCYKRFLLQVKDGSIKEPLEIVHKEYASLTFGTEATLELEAKGGKPPYQWKVENLPMGMQLVGNLITGIPIMGGGLFPLNITVEDEEKSTDSYFYWLHIN